MNLQNRLDSISGGNSRDSYIILFFGYKLNMLNTHTLFENMYNTFKTSGLRGIKVVAANICNSDITRYLGNKRTAIIIRVVSVFKRIAVIIQNLHLSVTIINLKQGVPIILVTLVFLSIVSCKKDKGMLNLEWQNESLSLTAEICTKYRECADKEWKSIPDNLKKFTEGRLEETQCQKRFRESNAYKLIGADPLAIQTAYKECYSQVLKFSCKDLQKGKLDAEPSCIAFQKIQNGN
ncbi:LA_2478/LA_2722/LA_4182 family protein [Leptospira abararensis]|uniref:LA_2478/LA_2722/LA_4182 family protein n=1 Tax=Leptospira abararensis TaxID=2810036 RepID=UPI001E540C93|nr:hypothetical protein [Leptospira abararensis]